MSDLFKKPIICNLKPSKTLTYGFSFIALIPIVSLLTLIQKYPFAIGSLILAVVASSIYYIRLNALRVSSHSIVKIRLHNGLADTEHAGGITKTYKIKRASIAPEWVLLILQKPGPKVIIDETSVDRATYSAIRREITIKNN